MRIVTSAAAMQRLTRRWRNQETKIGLVPTMGFLHQGHLSLVKRARRLVGPRGKVVVSIYVNPTQFGPREDLSRYPRDFARDTKLCRAEGVDVIFAPNDREMYPQEGAETYSTYVVEESLSRSMEGVARPTHFRGVTTVVAKLFNLVQPEVAVFGAKDFQQAAIIQRMVRDLNFPIRIIVCPTYRESDGLAMSSRNKYLLPTERGQATALWLALEEARRVVRSTKNPVSAKKLRASLSRMILTRPAARIDYIEFFDAQELQPLAKVGPGTQMALVVFIGKTRLIDNGRL